LASVGNYYVHWKLLFTWKILFDTLAQLLTQLWAGNWVPARTCYIYIENYYLHGKYCLTRPDQRDTTVGTAVDTTLAGNWVPVGNYYVHRYDVAFMQASFSITGLGFRV
jgi:hypothetical protein